MNTRRPADQLAASRQGRGRAIVAPVTAIIITTHTIRPVRSVVFA